MVEKNTYKNELLKTIAIIVVLIGAVSSLVLMFNAGRNQKSIFLIAFFTIWVLSPFVALLVANVISKGWPILMRRTLHLLMLFITFGSLISYSGALSPPGTKPAFKFLITPLVSWVLMATIISITRRISRKKSEIN